MRKRDEDHLLKVIEQRKIKSPEKGIYGLARVLLKFSIRKTDYEFFYHMDTEAYRDRPVVLLGDHSSRSTFYYVLSGYPFTRFNVVVGLHNLLQRWRYGILLKGQVIVKRMYEPDLRATRDMLRVVKKGGSLCLFPEGIQSNSGSTMPINPATVQLLQAAGLDVILCKSFGAYLANPRYTSEIKRGRQEYHYEVLFTKEELREKSPDELYKKLMERFRFNDFEWNRTARNAYAGKEPNAKGLETMLYVCPKCHGEFTMTSEGNDLVCASCGNRITVNEYYDLIPQEGSVCPFGSIDEWFKDQRRRVREEVKQADFRLEYPAEFRALHTERLHKEKEYALGSGNVTIDASGIRYTGTKKGENVDILYDIRKTPSFILTPGKDNDLYYDGEYVILQPLTEPVRVVKYTLAVEELHNLTDPAWDRASRDVYG